jgi:Leucine-rich repeat (LRR) protein
MFIKGLINDLENSTKIIKSFEQKNEKIKLDIKAESISIINKKLNDNDFKNLSHITFKQLIEIDISENNIINIAPFKTMSLPFLEFLNLGHNLIKNIEPIMELKSKNLQYIFLQNNKIEDIKPILDSDF